MTDGLGPAKRGCESNARMGAPRSATGVLSSMSYPSSQGLPPGDGLPTHPRCAPIAASRDFFERMGVKTRLRDNGLAAQGIDTLIGKLGSTA